MAANIADGLKKSEDVFLLSYDSLSDIDEDELFRRINMNLKGIDILPGEHVLVMMDQELGYAKEFKIRKEIADSAISHTGRTLVDLTSHRRAQLENIIDGYFVNSPNPSKKIAIEEYRKEESRIVFQRKTEKPMAFALSSNMTTKDLRKRNVKIEETETVRSFRRQLENQNILFQEARRQEEEIRDKYRNTDIWMKALDGNDSKLNERQWAQVRTENFKRWFGDWETDPQNASKIVGSNGEPLILYHGTPNGGFSIFDPNAQYRMEYGDRGLFFFTSNPGSAGGFAIEAVTDPYDRHRYTYVRETGSIYPVFLDMKNPLDLRTQEGIDFVKTTVWQSLLDQSIVTESNRSLMDNPIYRRMYLAWSGILQYLDDYGYDGMIADRSADSMHGPMTEYAVLRPEQIKSAIANNGNFDSSNPDIRFQTSNSWMEEKAALEIENVRRRYSGSFQKKSPEDTVSREDVRTIKRIVYDYPKIRTRDNVLMPYGVGNTSNELPMKKGFRLWLRLAGQSSCHEILACRQTVIDLLQGILSHARYSINSGKVEGTNNMVKTIKKQAYRF
ncbi:MAG: transposase, partial [Spirochaetales bacterium]|nr:transposase [Spirochaetales bacterium]